MSIYNKRINTMSEEEARTKICPLRSIIEDKFCIASCCMWWKKTLKNKYCPNNLQNSTAVLYDKQSSEIVFEGFCGILEESKISDYK